MNPNAQMNPAPQVSALDRTVRILHLEDSARDRDLVSDHLEQKGLPMEITDVDNEADFVKALEQKTFDIILSDKSLPDFDGLTARHIVKEKLPHIPFVFVTGSMGEEAAIETIQEGATDYVLKDRLGRLIPAIERGIHEAEQAKKARESEEKIHEQAALLDKAQDAILVTDVDDHVLYWNKSAERIYGWSASETLGRKVADLLARDVPKYQEARKCLLEKGNWTGELTTASRDGREVTVESRWTLVCDETGTPKSILIIDTDVTEKKKVELIFLRAQRMDSIGALAGGIAHDLNNALAPVIMGAEIIRNCPDDLCREKFLDIISSGAHRATSLVKQIVSFARGSGGHSGPVSLSHLIREMGKMIQDTFPKSISFSFGNAATELWIVQGDATEFHQVLLNLCVNARDAMPKGGQLTLSAQNVTLVEPTHAGNGSPGRYVLISVGDTGTGIPPDVIPRIFEPFFTTKAGDTGTGLGLSTVAGIVKHHGGFVEVATALGKGTEFKVYLPAMAFMETSETESDEPVLPMGHRELILVIDDEEAVRELTKTMLETYGYRVITAQDGVQGIDRFTEFQNEIRLVVTDTDMPYLDGMGTIHAIRELKPDMPIIVASGSKSDTEQVRRTDLKRLKNLGKPYRLEQLLLAVDTALKL
jgi:two-component system, cell cycle sensor histidine kinase and response regulator CckA